MYLSTYMYSCVVKALVGCNTELIKMNVLPSREKLHPKLHVCSSIKSFVYLFLFFSLFSEFLISSLFEYH